MRLSEIKAKLISEFFSSQGEGCLEEQINERLQPAFDMVNVKLAEEAQVEFEDASAAYRSLSKSLCSVGVIVEDGQVLYGCVRRGKQAASINFTSPTQTPRFCSLREIRDAFKEAALRDQGAVFKTINISQ